MMNDKFYPEDYARGYYKKNREKIIQRSVERYRKLNPDRYWNEFSEFMREIEKGSSSTKIMFEKMRHNPYPIILSVLVEDDFGKTHGKIFKRVNRDMFSGKKSLKEKYKRELETICENGLAYSDNSMGKILYYPTERGKETARKLEKILYPFL